MPLTPGTRLGPYEILGPIGAGGMGEVHRAHHLKLDRDVAVKVLPAQLADDDERLARLEREARAASALNHPNIVTIHDIGEHAGTTFIAMELVAGRTLQELAAEEPMPVDEVLDLASQIADGLAKAHAAGVLHRDIKPANLMVTDDGLVKILDFGLAKPLATAAGRNEPRAAGRTEIPASRVTTETAAGTLLGTPRYMSPEQLSEGRVDHRSDQFAFGVTLYEILTGELPFEGTSLPAVVTAILTRPAPSVRDVRKDVPSDLAEIIERCLEKDPDDRFASMAELGDELSRLVQRRQRARHGLVAKLKRPAVGVPVAVVVSALLAGAALWLSGAERRWAEEEAMAEITDLIESGELYGAYRTVLQAEEHRPDDPELERVFERITLPVRVDTEPEGARIVLKEYGAPDAEWQEMGTSPRNLRIPYELMHWRIEKEGYEPFEGAPFGGGALAALSGLVLDSAGERPRGMVRVPGGPARPPPGARPARPLVGARLDAYYLDRYEVTNREFEEFVDAGGYRNPEWWPSSLTREGEETSFEAAVDAFRDPTGRHGPSTWERGDYPEGEGDHPVSGISWFEAWAYCAFAEKRLPTIYHWFHAIGQQQRSEILVFSNMDGDDKVPVGTFEGLTAYGAYDMAGNVKEWAWNPTGGLRAILGGAWDEPTYLFKHLIGQDPWAREATDGVRCARYREPPHESLTAPVTRVREYTPPEPVSDEAFEVMASLYEYDRDSLDARIERVDSVPDYRRETVSIRTAYGDERMEVHLLIPDDTPPPYQSVVWFPGDDVFALRSSESFASSWLFDFLPRDGGRAVVYPVYRGMYERFESWERTPNDWRDMVISWARDVGRTMDYLETRPDFDTGKVAYYGFSAGALYAPVFMVVEPRLAVSMVIGGGLLPGERHPAMDPAHFAPRTRTPILMINGEDDFIAPYEAAQLPYLEIFGAPDSMKRLARLPGGHIPSDTRDIRREVLNWLDRHLGPTEATPKRRAQRPDAAAEPR